MSKRRPRIVPNLLLVEGKEDLQAVPYLLEANGIIWDSEARKAPVWIEQYEGYSNLLKSDVIGTELKTNGLQALGVMVDADEDLASRWQEVRNACVPSIPDLPDEISNYGLIHITAAGTRFGVWIMPDNQSCGMLETFLAYMIPDEQEPLWVYAQDTVNEAKKQGASFIENHTDKAKIYTWLAWQKPPGQPFSYALKDEILNPKHLRSQSFVAWFKSLYSL